MAVGDTETREARAALRGVYERFSEGFGSADLEEAARLLGAASS